MVSRVVIHIVVSQKAAYYLVEGDVFADSETSILALSILKHHEFGGLVVYLLCCVVFGVSNRMFVL